MNNSVVYLQDAKVVNENFIMCKVHTIQLDHIRFAKSPFSCLSNLLKIQNWAGNTENEFIGQK